MTMTAKLLCAAAVCSFAAAIASAPAQALTMQECSSKYQAAKTGGTLNGEKWNDFRKTQCGADATTAAAPAAPPPITPTAAEAKPSKPPKSASSAAPAAPVETGNAVFPTAIDPKFASEKPHMQRMHTCSEQWKANKDNHTTGGMRWNQKGGGGFYSVCNTRLKGEG
jgi:hypothetical protein